MSNKIAFVPQQVIPFGPCPSDQAEMLKRIELCGRVAYKSEDKITEGSALKFVAAMVDHRHFSVLEHSNIVLAIDDMDHVNLTRALGQRTAYHPIRVRGGYVTIAGNVRAWLETLEHFDRLWPHYEALFSAALCSFYPEIFGTSLFYAPHNFELVGVEHQGVPDADLQVFTFGVVTNRSITHEFVRHRVLSFTQESTRYVNYGKRGCEIMLSPELAEHWDIVNGRFLSIPGEGPAEHLYDEIHFYHAMFDLYLKKLAHGVKPQIARDVLAHALKAEIFVSGRWSGWKHFIRLRYASGAHPYIKAIAEQIHAYFLPLGMDAFDGE